MTGALSGWLDVTSPIASMRRAQTVTVALRHPGKGRRALEILVYASLATQLGWQGGVRVRVLLSPDQRRLALRPDESGKKLRDRSGSLAMSHHLEWLLQQEARSAEPVRHEMLDGALVLDLPEWAWPDSPHPATAITAAELNALGDALDAAIVQRREPPRPVAPGGPRPSKLTPEREALFRRLWLDPAQRPSMVLQAVNALPGEPYESQQALYSLAKRLGLPTQRPLPAADATAPPATATAPVRASPTDEEDEREAEALIRQDPARRGVRWAAEEYGWTLERAQRLVFRVREAMRAEGAGGVPA